MSLITEALKKARQEAARQEALKQGSAYPWMAAPAAPVRSQTRSALVIGVLAGCLAAGLGTAGAVWWLSGRMAPQTAPAAVTPETPETPERVEVVEVVEEVPAAAPPPQPVPPMIREEAPVILEETAPPPVQETPPPTVPVRPAEPAPGRPDPAPAETPAAEPSVAAPVAPAVPSPAPQSAPAAESAAAAAGLENGKTYVREVPVPGGGSLRLNGIAFSDDNPVALFSDRVVTPGETIGGFKVVGMDVKQVELEGHGVKVFVALK